MSSVRSWLGILGVSSAIVVFVACAGEETDSSSAGGGEGGDPTSGPATGSGGAGGAGGGAGGAGGQGGGAGGAGGGGSSDLVPSLMTLEMYADCMPIVDADPVHGTFTASYDNSAGASTSEAVISSAKLVFSDGKAWTFKVAPSTSGMVGPNMSVTAAHQKQNGSGNGTVAPCSYCGQMWSLEVAWSVGGSTVTDSIGPQAVECVF
jgi:hypothetical protein